MNFNQLIDRLKNVHERLATEAVRAVNAGLTVRNWLIGMHLYEFEQNGSDRAAYGEQLVERVAERLAAEGLPRTDARELRRYRQFYLTYPQIREALPPESSSLLPAPIRESATPESSLAAERLLRAISFTHFVELLKIEDPTTRSFYEIECIRGQWSARELKRQISSLLYERSGLSLDKAKLTAIAQAAAESDTPALAIRDPYVFEFLGLKPCEAMRESDLEDALLDKIEQFLLELGKGFCFEARQKRLLIGDEHFFVDLVFYHRILKCHVLIELKVDGFKHEYLGQLNTYVNWYRENEMSAGDNPPVGILLCTAKNQALVRYALAGIDNRLFVSKYQLELPDEAQMRAFLEAQMRGGRREPRK